LGRGLGGGVSWLGLFRCVGGEGKGERGVYDIFGGALYDWEGEVVYIYEMG